MNLSSRSILSPTSVFCAEKNGSNQDSALAELCCLRIFCRVGAGCSRAAEEREGEKVMQRRMKEGKGDGRGEGDAEEREE